MFFAFNGEKGILIVLGNNLTFYEYILIGKIKYWVNKNYVKEFC